MSSKIFQIDSDVLQQAELYARQRNINLNKWDKPFPEEDVVIKSKDDLVILIIVENEEVRATIVEAFNNL